MIAYFLGVWPGERCGHCDFLPDGARPGKDAAPSPWGVESKLFGYRTLGEGPVLTAAWGGWFVGEQPEGLARVVRSSGWTLVTMWDRSGDPRFNSSASFALCAELEPAEALDAARKLFPAVFERIETRLGRPVMLVEGAP